MSGFEELGVSEEFVKGLAGLKIFQPTKIQEKVVDFMESKVLERTDTVACLTAFVRPRRVSRSA